MKRPSNDCPDEAALAEEAARWLARRDRGLTPAEQDAYMQWLTADPRHAEVLVRHAAAFERMMQLYDWQPGQSAEANPDLFAPRPLRPWRLWGLVAAAALVLGVTLLWRESIPSDPSEAPKFYLRVNERRALPDGSVVELKDGSRINLDFSAEERRVQLFGEAHFQVAKSAKPFVVVAAGVTLRAVGTAFNVRLDAEAVDVLVTEGRIAVAALISKPEEQGAGTARRTPFSREQPDQSSFGRSSGQSGGVSSTLGLEDPAQSRASDFGRPASELVAGQRAVVPLTPAAEPRISEVSPAEAKEILSWQAPRLQFFETPLAVAVGEFNRHNQTRLVIADRELGRVRIGGTFRADNPEGFVRVLELTLEVRSVPRADREILLTRAR